MPTLIIKSNASQGTDVIVGDLGILIPNSGGSETITDLEFIRRCQKSYDLRTYITDDAYTGTSTLILNDGSVDLPQDDAEAFLDTSDIERTGSYSVPVRDEAGEETTATTRNPCRVATTGNVATLAGGAPDPLDGVSLAVDDRILVKDQSTASQNGIYKVQTVGTGANGTWVRSSDADESAEMVPAMTLTVSEGALWQNTSWMLTTNAPITLDTTALTFQQFGQPGADGDITWQGTWSTGDYTVNQAVLYNGSAYVCILNTTAQQDPTNSTYWDLMVSKGDTGATGAPGPGDYPNSIVATVGANITLSGGAPDTLDGVSLSVDDIILVKDQTDGSENGIYDVVTVGTGSNGTWSRNANLDESSDAIPGGRTTVTNGTTHPDSQWILTTNLPITLDTTVLTFEQINSIRHVEGPGAAVTDNAVVIWDGTTSTLVQGGVATLDPATGNLALGSGNITTSGTVDGVDVSAHASRHVSGAADVIDGDTLDITWNPTNYTPATTPTEVTSVDELTAHLYGIDVELGNVGPPWSSITTATDTQTETTGSPVPMPNMTVTPAAGTYAVDFSCATSMSVKGNDVVITLYSGGAEVTGASRSFTAGGNNYSAELTTMARVTVNGAQAIAGYWYVTGGTGTVTNRMLRITEVS